MYCLSFATPATLNNCNQLNSLHHQLSSINFRHCFHKQRPCIISGGQSPLFVTPHAKRHPSTIINPLPAETLTQFCLSSNHQTFLPAPQPIAAHPDICFATNTEWTRRIFPNPATELPPMVHPRCNPVLQDQPHFTTSRFNSQLHLPLPYQLFQPNTLSPPLV